jgi:PPOX class probable F420-dependent enzyme
MAKLTEAQTAFLRDNPFVGVATTLRDDGSPHNTVVWVDVDDTGSPSFNTARGRAKPRHIVKDPRVSLTMVDPQNPWHWVSVSGKAELVDEGADGQIDKLAKKYLGKDEYPWRNPEEQRVTVRITPEHVDSAGFDGG